MSQPKRKRQRVDAGNSTNTQKQTVDMSQLVKDMIKEAVPGIAQAVAAELRSAPLTATDTPTTERGSEQSCELNEPSTSQITTTPEGNTLNITGPLQAGRPLSQTVDLKIKSKIWANEYIQLGSLLFKNTQQKLQAFQGEDNQITFTQKEQKYFFKGFQQWLNAFQVFVAVYCEKFPTQSPALMKYMATIQKLSTDVGDKAAYHYDEQFRMWRADNPQLMPWDTINLELHAEALQIGIKQKIQGSMSDTGRQFKPKQPFRGKQPQARKVCFSYNNNEGICTRQNCMFPHICIRCHGDHHKKVCPAGSEGTASDTTHQSGGGQTTKQTRSGTVPTPNTRSGQPANKK